MKNFLILAVLLGMMAFTVSTFAATATANATADILGEIGIANTHPGAGDLKFGTMVSGSNTSFVKITAEITTVRSLVSGNAVFVIDTGNAPQSAKFDVSGAPSAAYTITLPVDDCVLHNTRINHTAETMRISDWSSSIDTTANAGALDVSGAQSFYVGGTLLMYALQGGGLYTGYLHRHRRLLNLQGITFR